MRRRDVWLAVALLGFVGAVLAATHFISTPEPAAPVAEPTPPPVEQAPVPVRDAGAQDAGGAAGAPPQQPATDSRRDTRSKRRKRAEAQGVEWLARSLGTSSAFRVRVRAAIMLGRHRGDARATLALVEALADSHPAVRTAAANSLGKVGGATALSALERRQSKEGNGKVKRAIRTALAKHQRKPASKPVAAAATTTTTTTTKQEVPVQTGPRYYVGVSKPNDSQGRVSPGTMAKLERTLRSKVGRLHGVRLARKGQTPSSVKRVLDSEKRHGFYLDVSISEVGQTAAGTRATVGIMVGTYPGRDMRAMLKGSATLPGGSGDAAAQLAALQGAVQSAVRKLPQVFARASH